MTATLASTFGLNPDLVVVMAQPNTVPCFSISTKDVAAMGGNQLWKNQQSCLDVRGECSNALTFG